MDHHPNGCVSEKDCNHSAVLSEVVRQGERKTVFDDVIVRVSEKYAWAMHIDTDESNAACAVPGTMGVILD